MPKSKPTLYIPAYALCHCDKCEEENQTMIKSGRLVIIDWPQPSRESIEQMVDSMYSRDVAVDNSL